MKVSFSMLIPTHSTTFEKPIHIRPVESAPMMAFLHHKIDNPIDYNIFSGNSITFLQGIGLILALEMTSDGK